MELKGKIENQVFDEERALYNLKDTDLAFEYSDVEADIKGLEKNKIFVNLIN